MASQLRLQVLAPIAIVAVLGLAVSAFVMSRNQPGGTDADAVAARIAAKQHQSPTKPKPKPEPTATTPATPPKPPHKSHPQGSSLKVALAHHPVVVVLFYSPNASYDAIATREARAGALAANAGFVTVNVLKNSQVAKLAAAVRRPRIADSSRFQPRAEAQGEARGLQRPDDDRPGRRERLMAVEPAGRRGESSLRAKGRPRGRRASLRGHRRERLRRRVRRLPGRRGPRRAASPRALRLRHARGSRCLHERGGEGPDLPRLRALADALPAG